MALAIPRDPEVEASPHRTVHRKLNYEVAHDIRVRYATEKPKLSMTALALEYNVSRQTIFLVLHNVTYREPELQEAETAGAS